MLVHLLYALLLSITFHSFHLYCVYTHSVFTLCVPILYIYWCPFRIYVCARFVYLFAPNVYHYPILLDPFRISTCAYSVCIYWRPMCMFLFAQFVYLHVPILYTFSCVYCILFIGLLGRSWICATDNGLPHYLCHHYSHSLYLVCLSHAKRIHLFRYGRPPRRHIWTAMAHHSLYHSLLL